jgi:hypothetical protein
MCPDKRITPETVHLPEKCLPFERCKATVLVIFCPLNNLFSKQMILDVSPSPKPVLVTTQPNYSNKHEQDM